MTTPEPSIIVTVDPTNPGQFFACCGLLELAERLWPGAEGWFEDRGFCIQHSEAQSSHDAGTLLKKIATCSVNSSMTDEETDRLKVLKNLNKKKRTIETEAETARLNELWKRERIHFGSPFELWLDWWSDDNAGGSSLKTWAGKQFIIELVRALQEPLCEVGWKDRSPNQWLSTSVNDGRLPLYFDSTTGGCSSSIDVGYSLDALEMPSTVRPLTELLSFIGLQRFRPQTIIDKEIYRYCSWEVPLAIQIAPAACSGQLALRPLRTFEFRILYRTKYLKGFLPANPLPSNGD